MNKMFKLKKIWIEQDCSKYQERTNKAIRIDWDNDRHQRIEIPGDSPTDLINAFQEAARRVDQEFKKNHRTSLGYRIERLEGGLKAILNLSNDAAGNTAKSCAREALWVDQEFKKNHRTSLGHRIERLEGGLKAILNLSNDAAGNIAKSCAREALNNN